MTFPRKPQKTLAWQFRFPCWQDKVIFLFLENILDETGCRPNKWVCPFFYSFGCCCCRRRRRCCFCFPEKALGFLSSMANLVSFTSLACTMSIHPPGATPLYRETLSRRRKTVSSQSVYLFPDPQASMAHWCSQSYSVSYRYIRTSTAAARPYLLVKFVRIPVISASKLIWTLANRHSIAVSTKLVHYLLSKVKLLYCTPPAQNVYNPKELHAAPASCSLATLYPTGHDDETVHLSHAWTV